MNEIQMLFHSLPVSEARLAEGVFPVSGLWFSGGGEMPEGDALGFAAVQGDCALVQGLQKLATAKREEVLHLQHAPGRAVFDADPGQWLAAVETLNAELESLMQQSLTLHPCDGAAWHWQPGMRYRLWRRRRPLARWLEFDAKPGNGIVP